MAHPPGAEGTLQRFAAWFGLGIPGFARSHPDHPHCICWHSLPGCPRCCFCRNDDAGGGGHFYFFFHFNGIIDSNDDDDINNNFNCDDNVDVNDNIDPNGYPAGDLCCFLCGPRRPTGGRQGVLCG